MGAPEIKSTSGDLAKEHLRQEALGEIEKLKEKGIQCVVPMPYSSNIWSYKNIKGEPNKKGGQPYLSYFSSMCVIASAKVFDKINATDFTFVGEDQSTTLLMGKKFFQTKTGDGEKRERKKYFPDDFETRQSNNTAYQIDILSRLQRLDGNPQNLPYLVVGWELHLPRLKRLAKAYGLKAEFISIETILYAYYPNYNFEKFAAVMEEFKKRDNSLPMKILGLGKGTGSKLVTRFRSGRVNDIQVVRDENGNVIKEHLTLLETTKRKRMKEVKVKPAEA